ncbi:MAG: ankyrin repeat domain-containing protein [Chloroflexi bacterium]|nr:ankyrin repeat domain-containing protein [Chloroflexota bacterium]
MAKNQVKRTASTEEFLEAVRAGDLAQVKALLEASPSLANAKSESGLSPILVALYFGHHQVAALSASRKADLDIHEASSLGEIERVKYLVEGDPSLASSYSVDGYTPLALAAYLGQKETVQFLISKGADVNAIAKNESRFTALTGAVSSGHRAIVELLLTGGADPNHRYEEGITPLFAAAANGDPKMIELLLARGADASVKTPKGQTALSIALEKGHNNVAGLLRRHGAAT